MCVCVFFILPQIMISFGLVFQDDKLRVSVEHVLSVLHHVWALHCIHHAINF